MSERYEMDLDAALAELAADVAAGTPRPGTDLTARVLADAAAVSAAMQPAPKPRERRAGSASPGFSLGTLFRGWAIGTVAAVLALMVGVGIGMEMDSNPLQAAEDDDPSVFVSDGGFLPDDFL